MFYRLFALSLLLIFLLLSNLFSQKQIEIIHSDSVIGYKLDKENVRDFIGNVLLRQGNIELRCEKATHFVESNSAILRNKVQISNANIWISSEYIEYNGDLSEAASHSKITIIDSTTKLTAKSGYYNFKTNIAFFRDSVTLSDNTSQITANEIVYDKKTQTILAIGNTKLETDSLLIYADTLEYERTQMILIAKTNVRVYTKFEGYIIYGGYIYYNRKDRLSWAIKNPSVIYIDSTIKEERLDFPEMRVVHYDSLFIFADSIVATSHLDRYYFNFYHNVKFFRGNITGLSSYAFFEKVSGFGYFVGKPILWVDSTELRADSVCFRLAENKFSEIELVRNGVIYSPSKIFPENINIIQSDTFCIHFDSGKIRYVLGVGNTKTSYFLESEEEGVNLANYSSDSLKIFFNKNEASVVTWFGNVYGEVIPDRVFLQNLHKYYTQPYDYLIFRPKRFVK